MKYAISVAILVAVLVAGAYYAGRSFLTASHAEQVINQHAMGVEGYEGCRVVSVSRGWRRASVNASLTYGYAGYRASVDAMISLRRMGGAWVLEKVRARNTMFSDVADLGKLEVGKLRSRYVENPAQDPVREQLEAASEGNGRRSGQEGSSPRCTAPIAVRPRDGESGFTNPVMFQWSSVRGAVSYDLAWDGVPGQTFVRWRGIIASSATVQRVQNPGQPVYWQVRAHCGDGVASGWSPERVFVMR